MALLNPVADTHAESGIKVEVMLSPKWWHRPYYKLLEPIELAGFHVPAGFVSDGATVPRFLWPLFPPIGRYLKATLVHDLVLRRHEKRKLPDAIFKACLKELNIQPWRIWAMYKAVRFYSIIKSLI